MRKSFFGLITAAVFCMSCTISAQQITIDKLPFIVYFKSGTLFYSNGATNEIMVDKLTVYAKQNKTIAIKPNDGFVLVFE